MAVDDSSAPQGIPKSGEISPGNTGANRSINLVKNIKTSTSRTEGNSSVNSLRNWFRTYVGITGNFSNAQADGQQVNLSDFYDTTILGVIVTTRNETTSQYGTNDDAIVNIGGLFGEKYKYYFSMNNQQKVQTVLGSGVSFTGLPAGTQYNLVVSSYDTDDTVAQPSASFKITVAYDGAGNVRGQNTTGIGSFGSSTSPITFTYSGGAGRGKTSNPLYMLQGLQDPSGRPYGTSMSYP
tara:strand:+ start:5543 stop:6256 length:714 start_codon:yes stop_codon:yes gene_type:complete